MFHLYHNSCGTLKLSQIYLLICEWKSLLHIVMPPHISWLPKNLTLLESEDSKESFSWYGVTWKFILSEFPGMEGCKLSTWPLTHR